MCKGKFTHTEKSTFRIVYCLSWCVQRMKPILEDALKDDVAKAIRDTCEKRKWELLELQVNPDHVIARVQAAASDSAEGVVKILKTASAAGLRQKHVSLRKLPGLWKSRAFFAATEGEELPTTPMQQYCEAQRGKKA